MIEIEVYKTIPDHIEEDFNSILYVDDEESNLRVFDSVFSRYYNVYTANNGSTAIEMLHEHDVHMIITDQKMPEMTGTDLLEKTLEDFPDIIRIILTGFADIQAIIKAINKCSIYKYITKPYENSEIKEIIDKGLEIYNMRQEKYKQEGGAQTPTDTSDTLPESKPVNSELSLRLANDLVLKDEDFENYFDFHIDYRLKSANEQSNLYGDFVINADEEGSCMFFLTMKVSLDDTGVFSYLHIKSKLRSILERVGNDISLDELRKQLVAVYQSDESHAPQAMKILSYQWETGAISYLSQHENIKLYSIGDQLEPVKFKKKALKDDYSLFTAKVDNDLMMYFWDFAESSEATPEAADYFKQIINHATSIPFDLQESQIGSGIKSVSQHFEDALLYGIYIND